MSAKRILGKVALITGSSSGIGAETARLFASLGYSLALCGRNKDNLEAVGQQCQEKGLAKEKVLLVQGDLSIETDVHRTIDKTIEKYGQLDVLVNNAGILENSFIETPSMDSYDRVMNTNCRSVFLLTSLAVSHLIKAEGNVVNVSSVSGIRSFPGLLGYCMSKSALNQFTRIVALELASKKVRVNSVNPGHIITEIYKRSSMSDEKYAQYLEDCKTSHPLGRPGTADEVAKAIAFLASDDASFITGVNLLIDGGRGLMCPR